MGDKISLKLDERTVHGKKVKALRAQSLVPGVVYGQGFDPISVQADFQTVVKVYQSAGKHHPVYLNIAGKPKIAMVKDIDQDPANRKLRHISFHAVKQNEKVEAEVPIRLLGEGESVAEKAGLLILQNIDKIEVSAFPMDLPDSLEVDISGLKEAGERVLVSDIVLPENVELVDHAANQSSDDEESHSVTELLVASVWEPSALQAANEATGGDAEPGDEAEVDAEQGEDTPQDTQAEETRPGGKGQDEPKQSNIDTNK